MARRQKESLDDRERCLEIMRRLRSLYPRARCTLNYRNPLELLVATILAAQCTDERVNIVTERLFRKYRTAQDYARAKLTELENDIKSCGFFHAKARNIQRASAALVERFGGEVPDSLEALVSLDGVGRKTANVILNECFGVPGVIVDTHCTRLAKRLGLTTADDPHKIEQDLMRLWPREDWGNFSHTLVFHGRSVCLARSPRCPECVVRELCPYPNKTGAVERTRKKSA